MARVFYFGCRREKGHHLHASDQFVYAKIHETPWGATVDTGLCPKGAQVEGVTALHHREGWPFGIGASTVARDPAACS